MACEQYRRPPEYLTAQAVANIWHDRGGDDSKTIMMVAIAYAESSFDHNVVSDTCDFGLWQINWQSHVAVDTPIESLFDVRINADYAIAISHNGTNVGDW